MKIFKELFSKKIYKSPHNFECLGYSLYADSFMYQCIKCGCLIYTNRLKKVVKLNNKYGECKEN
jgi:hypothetical protein